MKCLPRAVFAALAVTVAQAALAQAPGTVQLEDMTWTELRDSIRAGKTTLLIPIGGTEQSGPYVALGKHNA
ncbi:MAG: creatininase family protein, partial [Burkholderia contaminans]